MKNIIIVFFVPCILFAQDNQYPSGATGQYQGSYGGMGQGQYQGGYANMGQFLGDTGNNVPNSLLRKAAAKNADRCPFLSIDESVPYDDQLSDLLVQITNSINTDKDLSQNANCTSVGGTVSDIYLQLYGAPVKKQASSDTSIAIDMTGQQVTTGGRAGCLNAADMTNNINCMNFTNDLVKLQQQLIGCNLKDKATVAGNIGTFMTGVGMIVGGNAAVTTAGAMIQIGSLLLQSIVPTEIQKESHKAKMMLKRNEKIDTGRLLKKATNCYIFSWYKGLYCGKTISTNFLEYQKNLVKSMPLATKYLNKEIQEQLSILKQYPEDISRSQNQDKTLITDCYNGYVFLNYYVDSRGTPTVTDKPTSTFQENCMPLIKSVENINKDKQKGWDLPTLFTDRTDNHSCTNLTKAAALTSFSDDVADQLMCSNFDGKTCKTNGCSAGQTCCANGCTASSACGTKGPSVDTIVNKDGHKTAVERPSTQYDK